MFMTNVGHVMTLANSIIGVGILAMPFCFYKCGIILSILLLVLNYLVTRISCYYLIRSALLARRKSFEFLGFYAFGASGKLMVELCIIGYLIGTCIAYFVVVGDLGPRIIAKILDLDDNDRLRTWVMIIATILCIIPLGLLRNIDSLSAVSAASVGFYICLVLKVISESQNHLMANNWYDKVTYWEPDGILQCLPIFSMACSCQMQLFEVMETVSNPSLDKMNSIVKKATRICTSVYVMVGLFGYIGFCSIPFTGNILKHFSDTLSSEIIKTGFVLSVAFSFPLVIFPCRVSIYSLLYKRGHGDSSTYIPEKRFKTITISIVLIALIVALMIPSIELVIGLVGSTIGVLICVMFPAAVYLQMFPKIRRSDKILAQVVLISGFCLMILGTYANLNAIDEKRSLVSTESTETSHTQAFHLPESIADKIAKKEIEGNKLIQVIPTIASSPSSLNSKIRNSKLPFESSQRENVKNSKLPIQLSKVTEEEKLSVIKDLKLLKEIPKFSIEDSPKLPVENSKLLTGIQKTNSKVIEEHTNGQINNQINNQTQNLKADLTFNDINQNIASKKSGEDIIKILEDASIKKSTSNTNNVIDKEAIKKDEEIAAEEEDKNKDVKLEKAEAELKLTKEILVKKVDELKLEIVKQNEETQKLVNEKLSDIIEKVNEIKEEVIEEKKLDQNKIADDNIKDNLITKTENKINDVMIAKGSLVAQLSEKIKGVEKVSEINNNIPTKINNLTKTAQPNGTITLKVENETENKEEVTNLNIQKNIIEIKQELTKVDQLKEKVYEPLSYKTGELINKINESKSMDSRAALPLPLLINSTNANNNKLSQFNNRNNNNIVTSINNQSQDLLKNTKLEISKSTNEINLNATNPILPQINAHTEGNIEAIRRDILEVKEVIINKNTTEKLSREKRDLRNVEYNLHLKTKNDDDTTCFPNCFVKNEPVKNLIVEELNNNFKMMTGGRDLKSIDDDKDEKKHVK